MSLSISYKNLLSILIVFNIFFPTFNNIFDRTGTTGVIIINFIMLSLILFILSMLNYQRLLKLDKIIMTVSLVFIIYIVSIISTSVLNKKLLISDIFELFRPVYYYCCFLLFYTLSKSESIKADDIVRFFSYVILASAIFSLVNIIFFNLFGREVMSFYAKDTLLPTRRFTGTFQNPYDFAFIGVLPLVYYLNRFLTKGGMINILFILVLFVTMIFGQSKSGLITFVFITVLVIFLSPFFVSKEKIKSDLGYLLRIIFLPSVAIFLFLLFFALYSDQFSYLINGLIKLSSGGDRSTSIRVEQAELALTMLDEGALRLMLGYGSYKDSNLLFESLYTLYFFRYGLLSILFLCCWLLMPLCFLFLMRFFNNNSLSLPTILIMFCFFLAVIPSGFGNNIIDQSRIPFVYFGFLGIVFEKFFRRD